MFISESYIFVGILCDTTVHTGQYCSIKDKKKTLLAIENDKTNHLLIRETLVIEKTMSIISHILMTVY